MDFVSLGYTISDHFGAIAFVLFIIWKVYEYFTNRNIERWKDRKEEIKAERLDAKSDHAAKKTEDRTSLYKWIDLLKEDNDRLRIENSKMLLRITELEKSMVLLGSKVDMMQSANHYMPFPMWIKDVSGVMLSLNDAYDEMFLKPQGKGPADYIGCTDYDIWSKEVADEFTQNDRMAFTTPKKYWYGKESIRSGNGHFDAGEYTIVKWKRIINGHFVGIAGMALPIELYLPAKEIISTINEIMKEDEK